MAAQVKFAKLHVNKSDETKVQMFGCDARHHKSKPNTAYQLKHLITNCSVIAAEGYSTSY